jgi:hypothetical protein
LKIENRNKLKSEDDNPAIMDIDELSDWSEDSDNLGAENDV